MATLANNRASDAFSQRFYFIGPFIVPIIVYLATFLFYSFCPRKWIWLPLILIYWSTIWGFTLFYRSRRGGVFSKDRFKFTLKLQGPHLGWQYLLVYGPLLYNLPIFIIMYAHRLSLAMTMALIIASAINGPSEEIFWRGCMDDAGKAAGVSEKHRLIFGPIAFAFWHTAFVLHLYPMDNTWVIAWAGILAMTWSSGIIWLWVLHKSGRIVPQCVVHAIGNFLMVFPMILITIVQLSF